MARLLLFQSCPSTMLLYMLITRLLILVSVHGGLNDVCSYISSCNSGGTTCGCNEVDSNCDQCSDGYGCTACDAGYFVPDSSSQCRSILCENIDHCELCDNYIGCIECHDGCSLLQATECDITVCRCGNFDTPLPTNSPSLSPSNEPSNNPSNNPTNKPSNNPSNNPTNNPTSIPSSNPTQYPTLAPTEQSLEDYFFDLFSNNLLVNPNATLTNFASDGILYFSGIAVGNIRKVFRQYAGGICDEGILSVKKDFVEFIDGKGVTYSFYNACFSSINGVFWLSGKYVNIFDENGLIKQATVFLFDETDIEYVKQYGESRADVV